MAKAKAIYTVYFVFLGVFLLAAGGALYLLLGETPAPGLTGLQEATPAAGVAGGAFAATMAAGTWLFLRDRKKLLFNSALFILIFLTSLYACEITARFFVPPWPAMGLHAVNPKRGNICYDRISRARQGVKSNSWGQRDRERTLRPAPGIYRVAFVGDSFLEDSTTVPVSLGTERDLGQRNVEVLNLGVSATDPDEYFYRTKNIALPLGARLVVLFIYSGNDLGAHIRTMPAFLGICAPYPRGSFLDLAGCGALNHLIMGRDRPFFDAWFKAGDLNTREQHLGYLFSQMDDDQTRAFIFNKIPAMSAPCRDALAERLERPEMGEFFSMLRHPDAGLFRSYHLMAAFQAASVANASVANVSDKNAWVWIKRTYELCRNRHRDFALVIVPVAFQVDPRVEKQWAPLADMRKLTAPMSVAAKRLADTARATGISVIDLHGVLRGIPGTYLNMDGHWSDKGSAVVAKTMAGYLRKKIPSGR